jgi:ribokinase
MTANLVVLGSFVVGATVRLPRMPFVGETLLADAFDLGPGGKGSNLAVAAARVGANVEIIAKIGRDDFGRMARDLYASEGVKTSYLSEDPDHPTAVGLVYLLPEGENTIGLYPGANSFLSASDVEAARPAIALADIATAQLEIPDDALLAFISAAEVANTPVLLNPAPARPMPADLLRKVHVLTPNLGEARLLIGARPGDTSARLDEVGDALLRQGPQTVIITLGGGGARVYDRGQAPVTVPSIKIDPVDTVGAGDAFNGGLAVALAERRPLLDAVQFATQVAGMSTRGLGAVPSLPRRAEVDQAMSLRRLPEEA